jgi:clan AA aspartic protease
MTGYMNDDLEAIFRLAVFDAHGQKNTFTVLFDTGFGGELSLTPLIATKLDLVWTHQEDCVLADGTEVTVDAYLADVDWFGDRREVEVLLLDSTPLVGMHMLANHDVRFRVVPGAAVQIHPINPST